jgi:hypothetical protein
MVASSGERLLLVNRSTLDNPQTLVTRALTTTQALGVDADSFYAGTFQGVYRLQVQAP